MNVIHHIGEGKPKGFVFSSVSLGSPCSTEGSERHLPLCLSSWGYMAKWEPEISGCPVTWTQEAPSLDGWSPTPTRQWRGDVCFSARREQMPLQGVLHVAWDATGQGQSLSQE